MKYMQRIQNFYNETIKPWLQERIGKLFIVSAAIWILIYSFSSLELETWPVVYIFLKVIGVLVAGLVAIDILSKGQEHNFQGTCFFLILGTIIFICIFVHFLFGDSDRNGIRNFEEIAYGLNPWTVDSKSNSDQLSQANLIDGCVIKWLQQGYELKSDKLPSDTDGDGCFDEIERTEGDELAYEFTQVPSFINPTQDDRKASARSVWEIRLGSGGVVPNPPVFKWQNFRFNNRREIQSYTLNLNLMSPSGGEVISFQCPRELGNDASLSERVWMNCWLPNELVERIIKFMNDSKTSEVDAYWQVSVGESVRLFTSDSFRNHLKIILPAQ